MASLPSPTFAKVGTGSIGNIKDCTEAAFEKTVNAGERSYQDASGAPLSGPHDIKITDTAPGTSGRAVPQNGREYSLGVICASESF